MKQVSLFKEKINTLLDQRAYKEVKQELDECLDSFNNMDEKEFELLAEIAGSYITLGSESYILSHVEKGLSLYKIYKEELANFITTDSIDYCVANGFHAIYKIKIQSIENYFPKPEYVSQELFEAKQSYLKAFKKINLQQLNDYSIKILTNLGNNLNHSGRIVEALQLFDTVLKFNPDFPQAVASKADGLRFLIKMTDGQESATLHAEMYRLYNKASKYEFLPDYMINDIKKWEKLMKELLFANSYKIESIPKEFEINHSEYLNHPDNLKYFLDNFMSLSEHSLYCKCAMSEIDNLSIGYPGFFTTNKKILELEALNNQIKSEFALARQLFYEFRVEESKDFIHYENVIPNLVIGLNHEKLRTSLRLCFGILDKIAEGICYLFDLTIAKNEYIYFETFWKSKKSPKRWENINDLKNIHLTALYSIACDLNKQNGEFGFYKIWRNKLEHGLFTLTNNESEEVKWENKKFSNFTSENNFIEKTKLILQITRASIFSYVFCVRSELVSEKNK